MNFTLRNSQTAEKHLIETITGGVALLDYDGDGRLDIFFANGASQPSLRKSDASFWNRLYRNRGNGTFEDVTEKAGVRGEGYSMGAAAADYDNDGRVDLFVTGVRGNSLYRNRGDGTFQDVTARAGLQPASPVWSVAAGWFDYDGDGWLDLFVVNYVQWDPAKEPYCEDQELHLRSYCHPRHYEGLASTLYHNNGNGTFTDASRESGIAAHIGKGMSVAFADYDGDGRPDIFVTNDSVPNFLFHNEGHGKFTEVGLAAGVAFNDDGRAPASMGADFRDIDNDGRPDLFFTAVRNETFPVYRNLGKGLFADITYQSLAGAATIALTGWAAAIYDFDNDGRKDLFAAGGDFDDSGEALGKSGRHPSLVLRQRADGKFDRIAATGPARHRGAAFGDWENDGRIGAVVSRIGERALLLRNVSPGNHWLGLKLEGTRSNRDAIGAVVHLRTAQGEQWNQVSSAAGYASSSDLRVHFGLGPETRATVEIRWPDGQLQKLGDVRADRYLAVKEP